MTELSIKRRRKQVFSSVFPHSSTTPTIPTPLVTPVPSFTAPGQSFGGPSPARPSFGKSGLPSLADERIAWSRAWHTATSLLSLPRIPVHPGPIDNGYRPILDRSISSVEAEALEHVLSSNTRGQDASLESEGQDLVEWFTNEVRLHYLSCVKPQLVSVSLYHVRAAT